MKRPALASVLGAFTLLGLFGLATPGALAGPAPSAVLAVGYPGQGSELLAVLQDGRVLSWGQGARPQTRWTLGPEAKGELHLLLQRRAVLRLVQDELTLFSLPDDGSPQELVKARGRVWAEVGPELLAVGDGRLVVVRSIDHGTERRFSWRANVTALAGGDDGTLVVADADSAVTWLDLSTFEPTRHLQLPHAARALFPLGERGVLANAGGAWLLDTQGGSKSLSTSWPGGMMGGQVLLVPRGPELQRFELAGSMGGPLFNHGIGVAALAGHPLQLVSAVVLEHELWRVTFRGQGHVEEQKLYEW